MPTAAETKTGSNNGALPYREAGLDERQAAAFLLDRFGFGARPGEVERVVAMGLDAWIRRQLDADLSDRVLHRSLKPLDAVRLSSRDLLATFPPPFRVLQEAREAGVVPKDANPAALQGEEKRALRDKLIAFGAERGYRPQRELEQQLLAQKILRGAYSENVLLEQLTDFWFNHFNVSIAKPECREFVLPYERDAIRPNALGRFRDLLEATATHPAMLLYLDNARSVADPSAGTTLDAEREHLMRNLRGRPPAHGPAGPGQPAGKGQKENRGLNENYGRELLELHTLGVDGGYTQDDVIAVARAFTGWTVYPARGPARQRVDRAVARARHFGGAGVVVRGDFLFRPDAHDAGPKTVLGRALPAGRGIEDGEDVLDLVAAHAATVRRIPLLLARRFVADEPPAPLVDLLASVFRETGGDIRAVMSALTVAPEFWREAGRRGKIKSPYEVAASSLRALGAEVEPVNDVARRVARMGEPLYAYEAPTGYPDRAEQWVNAGALLNRMNFALDLASGAIPGVRVDLASLAAGREPESADAALATYAALLLPGRDTTRSIAPLQALAREPAVAGRVAREAGTPASSAAGAMPDEAAAFLDEDADADSRGRAGVAPGGASDPRSEPAPLAHVVGILLGSPEFQRR
jgi:uncharacterized protein (DUF1800 family)